jgi:hypothetical protein
LLDVAGRFSTCICCDVCLFTYSLTYLTCRCRHFVLLTYTRTTHTHTTHTYSAVRVYVLGACDIILAAAVPYLFSLFMFLVLIIIIILK